MTGRLTISSTTNPLIQLTNTNTDSGDTYVRTTSWSGTQIAFGVGSGGANRGIYDYGDDSGWIVYKDSSNDIHLGSSTVGSASRPIYLSSGVPTACTSTTSNSWYIRDGWAWRTFANVTLSNISMPSSSYYPLTSTWYPVIIGYNSGFYLGSLYITSSGNIEGTYYSTYGGSAQTLPSSATVYGEIIWRYA